MKLGDIVPANSRLFAKSEFGPVSDRWPALSFSSHKIATDFANEYHRGRDFVIYAGTGDPKKTESPEHRQRLLSVVSVEPRAAISTRDLIPVDVWEEIVRKYGLRWEWSLPIAAAYSVVGFPRAHSVIPHTYRSLGSLSSLGRCVPVHHAEYHSLIDLEISGLALHLSARAREVLSLNTNDKDLRQELSRLVDAIKQDVANAGTSRTGVNPPRFAPNISDLFRMLRNQWDVQNGMCALCDRPIPLKPKNRLLQMSRDRTDSANKTYDLANTRLTHLGCNLAKSDSALEDWREYLALIRQV